MIKIYKFAIVLQILFFIITPGILFSQEETNELPVLEVKKSEFKKPEDKDGFSDAWKNVKNGDATFSDNNKASFELALDFYLKANKYNSENAELNYKIGYCYLKSVLKDRSIDYFLKAYKIKNDVYLDIQYMIGRSYQYKYEFAKALEYFTIYKRSLPPAELSIERSKIDKRIEECTNGIELMKKKERVFIDNLGDVVNSPYPDYGPVITADEQTMYFTSRRPNTTGGERNPIDNQFYEDIYVTTKVDGVWQTPKNLGKPVNTKGNDATIGLSADGNILLTYSDKNGGDIYISHLKGNEWTTPESISKNVNTKFHEADASISPDGNALYFVSNKTEDNFGMHDIYVSYKDANGNWGKPKNLGSTINTKYDERGVFIHPDGKTLYFSSQGHNSMGGFDIFKSTLQENGTWSKPENIGYPINTPDDDVFLVISADGRHGYYSSEKEGGYGEKDIYMITFLGPEKPLLLGNEDNLILSITNPTTEVLVEPVVEIKTMRLTIVKGIIKDAFSQQPIEAQIDIVDNEKNVVINTISSNSKTGKYLASLPSGKNYGLAVKCENYLFHSENFNIPQATNYQEITKDVMMNKVIIGAHIILNNIFFDNGAATLRDESKAELERLKKLLEDFPTIRVEISGHTDNVGSLAFNTKLSESRAKAVVDYLITNGIDQSRLEYKGYAFTQPIAGNETADGRQSNRRVEFKVLSK